VVSVAPSSRCASLTPRAFLQDHANAKNAEGGPASGPNRPDEQTNACADIHVTPDGKFLYGSNRGHDSLVRRASKEISQADASADAADGAARCLSVRGPLRPSSRV
jgi:hypothetical protein